MDGRRLRLKPNCTYRAEARMGTTVYKAITFETDERGLMKSFAGTFTCNSPEKFYEMADLFHFTKVENVTTGESWNEIFSVSIPSSL